MFRTELHRIGRSYFGILAMRIHRVIQQRRSWFVWTGLLFIWEVEEAPDFTAKPANEGVCTNLAA